MQRDAANAPGRSGRILTRRDFLVTMTATAVGGSVLACGVDPPTEGGPSGDVGRVTGLVTNLAGAVQPSLGRVILMYSGGQQVPGRVREIDPAGRFAFEDLEARDYQLRFHAPGVAYVPEPLAHPIRFSIESGKTTQVAVKVELGVDTDDMIEIYAGDDFFQLQPDGTENGTATVHVGDVICWYNVGMHPHTVTGGPWVDSGDMPRTASFIWIADRVGVFPYKCKYHDPIMQATLRVEA
jgi:plastocyanin